MMAGVRPPATAQSPADLPALSSLHRLLAKAGTRQVRPGDRLLIASDLHLGDGGRRDDFRRNSGLMIGALRDYYLRHGYCLILNGDIEELQRFELAAVRRAWGQFYTLLEEFARGPGLHKIFGNHDFELSLRGDSYPASELLESLCLTSGENRLLVFHGHQASGFLSSFLALAGFVLRYVATPLGIRAHSTSQDSRKKYRVERRVYAFSAGERIVSLIGHTHRPLFESLSKLDALKYRIEALCRRYSETPPGERAALAEEIHRSRTEVDALYEEGEHLGCTNALYNTRLLVPCLFNSGCAVGKRGFTALEIREGSIALVHWFDRQRSDRHLRSHEEPVERLGDSDYYRVILKEESLDYVFTRLRLLT
jgi:predicted phosphodiesterase